MNEDKNAGALHSIDLNAYPESEREQRAEMLANDVRRRLKEADRGDAMAWEQVDSREAWEAFRAPRLANRWADCRNHPSTPTFELQERSRVTDSRSTISSTLRAPATP